MKLLKLLSLITVAIFIVACSTTDKQFKSRLEKTLINNPEIVLKVIEKHPAKFMMTLQTAAKNAQADLENSRKIQGQKAFENAFNNPLKPSITDATLIRGPKDAPITIVEYSDFQCPFCAQGLKTVEAIMKKYPGKVRFIYKHLPLSFHPQAMITAQYFEAMAMQSPQKAFEFHDEVFKNQSKLKKGEVFLSSLIKKFKINKKQFKVDLKSNQISEKINSHIKEAKKFGIHGTPGFIINGIPVRGAYPAEHFEKIIAKLEAKGKLKL